MPISSVNTRISDKGQKGEEVPPLLKMVKPAALSAAPRSLLSTDQLHYSTVLHMSDFTISSQHFISDPVSSYLFPRGWEEGK